MLYHYPYSICSIMVRQTIAIRGQAKDAESEIPINEKLLDIFKKEQLSEHFLCDVNPEGQVQRPSHSAEGQSVLLLLTSLRSQCWNRPN